MEHCASCRKLCESHYCRECWAEITAGHDDHVRRHGTCSGCPACTGSAGERPTGTGRLSRAWQ